MEDEDEDREMRTKMEQKTRTKMERKERMKMERKKILCPKTAGQADIIQ